MQRRLAQLTVGSVGLSMLVVAGPLPGSALPAANAARVTASGAAKLGPQPTAKDGEVTSLRTATSRTYRLPSGVYQARVFGHAVNYRDARGQWQKLDDSFVATASGWQSRANPLAIVHVPSTLAGHPLSVSSSSTSAGFVLDGAANVGATVTGSTARFHNALSGVDVVEQGTDTGLKESLVLAAAAAPATYAYSARLSSGLRLAAAHGGSISILNAAGKAVWRVLAPTVVDSAGVAGKARYALSADGQTLTLSVDPAWLRDGARAFPVTIDPSVVGVSPSAETYLYSGAPTTNYSTATTEQLGHDAGGEYRLLVKYDVASALPKHVDILQSALQTESLSASAGAISVQTFEPTRAWTTSATWNTYDGTNSWSVGGGDTGSAIDTETVPNNSLDGDGDDAQWFRLQPLAASWYGGGTNNGLELEQSGTTQSVLSWPQGGSMWLNVDYVYHTGLRSYFNYYSRALNDRASFNVNMANGNMVLQEKDLAVTGVGVPLQLIRSYNSQGDPNPSAGGGFPIKWSQGYGRDVKTDDGWNDGELYYGPTGEAYWLEGKPPGSGNYIFPSGLNAFFKLESDGTHTLTFHKSGVALHFGNYGLNDTVKDKNSNTITLSYSTPLSTSSQLTSVTDTQGRSYSLSYTSGHITSMTDANLSPSRTWGYGYDGTNTYLTSYTDPAGHSTSYGYSGVGSTSCTAPTGILCAYTDARSNTTTFNYDSSDRVTSIQDPGGNCAGTPATGCVTFSYSDPSGSTSSSCSGVTGVVGSTTETDENGHTTIYCWDKGDKVLRTVDGDGHNRASTYDSNNDVETLNGDNTSNVFTVHHDTSGTSPTFNVLYAQRPGTGSTCNYSSSSGCPAQFTYPTQGGSTADYRPSSASDGQHNCTSFSYDLAGNMTDSYSGQSAGTGGCANGMTGTHQVNAYQGDSGVPNCGPSGAAAKTGELCSTTDGASHKTSFSYDSNGNLTTIAPPAPLGSTSVSVDGDGRPTSVTDGASRSTKYFYDGDDRITELRFDGGTSSTCSSSDATAGNCIGYSYDNNGNLTSRLDNTGTTSYTYDAFNRPLTKSFPSSISTTASTVTYDAVGNVATYVDAGTGTGQVAYTYDAANNLTKIAEPGGTCTAPTSKCITISYTNDSQRTTVVYPSGETVLLCYDSSNRETLVDAFRPSASAGDCHTPGTSPFLKRAYTYSLGGKDVDVRSEVTDQSGTNTFYGYDTLNRLCWTGTVAFSSCGSSTSRSFGYNYDNAGNITSSINGASTTYFGYNNADELCWSGSTNGSISSGSSACTSNAGPVGDTDYLYDGAGNTCWTASTTSTLNTCASAPTGATTYTYNSKGQNTAIGSTSFTYADVGQKELVTIGSTTLVNGLEGVTNRSDSVNVTRDAGGNLLELRNGNGTTSANSAYTLDALGSAIALTDSTGTTDTALYTYQPYGTTASSSGTLATTNPFRYASGYQLTTPSMYHFGDRYYNQAINRWTQRDSVAGSITDPASTDRYEYSGGDPINHVDITGMYWTSEAAQNGGSLNGAALASACVNGFAVGAIATGGDPLGGAVGCASSMLLESIAEVAPTNTDWPISSGNVIRLAGGLSDAWNVATSVF